ncbi:MAG: efflux RND transporter periplasmic adaptor subunit, partial [Azonexus sp.]
MRTGTTLIVAAIALAAGGFAGYRLALPKPEAVAQPIAVDGQKTARKLLYYRNPMGLPDTSQVPKKDPMGMDYLPVYEGEDETGSGLRISAEKIQKLGVKSAPAKLQVLDKTVRASGRIEVDESRTYTVTAKFEGYIERLYVNTSGQPVGRGQPLFEVYSPELVSAQREYAIAAQGVGQLSEAGGEAQGAMKQLAESSLQRLKNWDISEEQVKTLAKSGETKRTLTFRSPVAGVVTEKKAVQGMRFMPGETLFQIADTSTVWVQADVFEQDIAA